MKFLGIDYGIKRIGIAVSDEEGKLAFPKKTFLNDANTFKRIAEILKDNHMGEIVVGESLNFKNQPNALQARIEVFIKELEKRFGLPVHKQKEFLTTMEARKNPDGKAKRDQDSGGNRQKNKNSAAVDAPAAAIILQRYLDKLSKQKP